MVRPLFNSLQDLATMAASCLASLAACSRSADAVPSFSARNAVFRWWWGSAENGRS